MSHVYEIVYEIKQCPIDTRRQRSNPQQRYGDSQDFSLVYRRGVKKVWNIATDSFGWLANNYEISHNIQHLTWEKIVKGIGKQHAISI